jgi:hypothetical protein
MMDVTAELRDIGRLIRAAALIDAVRREVRRVAGPAAKVTDGEHHMVGSPYHVVVKLASGDEAILVARRLRGVVPAEVNVEAMADGVVGLRDSRRGKDGA